MSRRKPPRPTVPTALADVLDLLRVRGVPLVPSRSDKKAPLVPYVGPYYEGGEFPPASLFEEHPGCTAAQALMGRPFGFLAVDLDGPEAREVWRSWLDPKHGAFRTWAVESGGGGMHLWFRIPDWWGDRPIRSGFLWKGEGKHSGIERLGDRKLVMVPGSVHPETDRVYRFVRGLDPVAAPVPAPAPAWLMYRPVLESRRRGRRLPQGWLSTIPDKVALARRWGVDFTGQVRGGWHECRAIDREDRSPSAAVHEDSGFYSDLGPGDSLTFVQLAVAMGAFPTEEDAVRGLKEFA